MAEEDLFQGRRRDGHASYPGLGERPQQIVQGRRIDPAAQRTAVQLDVLEPGDRLQPWRPVQLRWAADGLLYTTLGGKLTVVEPRSLKSRTLAATALMTLAANGDVYYADGPDLIRVRDVTAPDAPAVTAPARPGRSADDTPEVSVRSEPGALIQLWNGDREVGRGTAGAGGSATVQAGPLAAGAYRLRVTATDAAGNRSEPAEVPLIVVA